MILRKISQSMVFIAGLPVLVACPSEPGQDSETDTDATGSTTTGGSGGSSTAMADGTTTGNNASGGSESGTTGTPLLSPVVGAWRTASGLRSVTCGDETTPLPMLTVPTFSAEPGQDDQLAVVLHDGCMVTLVSTADGAELFEAPECEVIGATGPATEQIDEVEISLYDPDEATFRISGSVTDATQTCTLEVSGYMTREDVDRPAVEVVADFGPGFFIEGIERDVDGSTWVMTTTPQMASSLYRIVDGEMPEPITDYPPGSFGTLVLGPDGVLYSTRFDATGMGAEPSIMRLNDQNQLEVVVSLPEGSTPNGITADVEGNLYVADSTTASVWRLPVGADTAEQWAVGGVLDVGQFPMFPGPNGIKIFDGSIYVALPHSLSIARIPVEADGSAGEAVVHVEGIGPDDFAIDSEGNIWATTHPFNGIVLVRPDGSKRLMNDTRDNVWGPTDAAFGKIPEERDQLFVTTDGNIFGSMLPPPLAESTELSPSLVLRISAGVDGAPEPG